MPATFNYLAALKRKQKEQTIAFKPIFFRLTVPEQFESFHTLLSTPGIQVYDYLTDQLKELIKCKNPDKKFNPESMNEAIRNHIQLENEENYGLWVYYPWSNRLVHLLDENEFIEVRTSRNQNKITKTERDILSRKKIGVIGLSVGQSVSVTLAMERVCGELRLADFDTLELTNLNRIRTGLHNLGLPKVYAVAREIAEIDPFIRVICYPEGLLESNMDDFFCKDGKLDLLIEESDGFDIKILSRYKARALKIPVIMEASDRCMVDVERFDLEPERPILHGLVEHLDIQKLKSLKSNEEKIPYMMDVLGMETASVRLKASMLEIEQTINTWPQLASAVTMGGGVTTDISRRLLLNLYTGSGRFHIDLEELVGDKKQKNIRYASMHFPELDPLKLKADLKPLALSLKKGEEIPVEKMKSWVQKAVLAPSAGNNQPWKWLITKDALFLYHDKNKSISWTDPFDHLAQLALGASLENLILAAWSDGYNAQVTRFPDDQNKGLAAAICFISGQDSNLDRSIQQSLFEAIESRHTNRKKGTKEAIPKEKIKQIEHAIAKNYELNWVSEEKRIHELSEIVSTVEMHRFLDPNGHHEFFQKEIRWTPEQVKSSRDGLDIKTLELSYLDQTGLKVASDPDVMQSIQNWRGGKGLQKISREGIQSASLIGLIRSNGKSKPDYLEAGQQMQRVWLMAEHLKLALHPISSPLFFFSRINQPDDLSADLQDELKIQEKKFNTIFVPDPSKSNLFLFRLSLCGAPTAVALKRNLEDSIIL